MAAFISMWHPLAGVLPHRWHVPGLIYILRACGHHALCYFDDFTVLVPNLYQSSGGIPRNVEPRQ